MFRLTPIPAMQFDLFRTLFGLFAAVMVGSLLFDRSLFVAFGLPSQVAMVAGTFSAAMWALCYWRKAFAVMFIFCLATIVETNPSALRVMPGYVGWVFFMSLFVPAGEGCWIRKRAAAAEWKFPLEVQLAVVMVLATSFTFSGVTKVLSPFWREGKAISIFAANPRFNWNIEFIQNVDPYLSLMLSYAAVFVEVFFLPLYLWSKTRRLAWGSLVGLFVGILILMRIYLVATGVLLLLIILYQPGRRVSGPCSSDI